MLVPPVQKKALSVPQDQPAFSTHVLPGQAVAAVAKVHVNPALTPPAQTSDRLFSEGHVNTV